MSSRPKILIAEADDFSSDVVEQLRLFADVELRAVRQEELKSVLETYDVFWFRLGFQIGKEEFSTDTKCQIIATPVTGIDHIDQQACKRHGTKIVCLKGEREFLKEVRATAELAIGIAMGVMRHIPEAVQSVKSGVWNRDLFRGNELYKKTMGIVGYGRLGKIVAEYALAFGMTVLVYDHDDSRYDEMNGVTFCSSLEEIAEKADVISIHVDLNVGSENLINKAFLKRCKPSAYLINTSRGAIVNDADLLLALQSKWIKGAALDVLTGEPNIDQNNPLVQYAIENRNLLIVPHIGGNTYESFEKTEQFIADKIKQHFEQ